MDTQTTKRNMTKDTMLYIPAKILEGIIGMLTITVYTSFFKAELMGRYSLASTIVNMACLIAFSWLFQSVYRYINSFKGHKKLSVLYSTAFRSWALINILLLALSVPALFIYTAAANPDPDITIFMVASLLWFISTNTSQVLFTILGATRRIKLNLGGTVFSIISKLLLFVVLYKLFNLGITTIVTANILTDIIMIVFIAARIKVLAYLDIRVFSFHVFKKFRHYGLPLLGVGITTALLNLSDRLVIPPLLGARALGIYSQNYTVASAVFTALNIAVIRGVYPSILQAWKSSNKPQAEELLTHAVRYYLLAALPCAVGLSVLSKLISKLFLPRAEYHEGWFVIIWVAFGMVFFGLTEYSNKAWELTSNTKHIFRNTLISSIFNITANVLTLRHFGYTAAAVNTTLSYLLYLILSLSGSRKELKWNLSAKSYIRILSANTAMAAVLLVIITILKPGKLELLFLVPLGAVVYGAVLYFTGEVKNEAQAALGIIRKRVLKKV